MMEKLYPFKIPDGKGVYVIFLQDPRIPKDIKAYIVRDMRVFTKAKLKVKPKKDPRTGRDLTILSAQTKADLMGRLHAVARANDYQFDRILDEALRQNRMTR